MPTKRIGPLPHPAIYKYKKPKPCYHPDHSPASHIVREPGEYKHTCPGCGRVVFFEVRGHILTYTHVECKE